MRIWNREFSAGKVLCLALYYGVARWLPVSNKMGGGRKGYPIPTLQENLQEVWE